MGDIFVNNNAKFLAIVVLASFSFIAAQNISTVLLDPTISSSVLGLTTTDAVNVSDASLNTSIVTLNPTPSLSSNVQNVHASISADLNGTSGEITGSSINVTILATSFTPVLTGLTILPSSVATGVLSLVTTPNVTVVDTTPSNVTNVLTTDLQSSTNIVGVDDGIGTVISTPLTNAEDSTVADVLVNPSASSIYDVAAIIPTLSTNVAELLSTNAADSTVTGNDVDAVIPTPSTNITPVLSTNAVPTFVNSTASLNETIVPASSSPPSNMTAVSSTILPNASIVVNATTPQNQSITTSSNVTVANVTNPTSNGTVTNATTPGTTPGTSSGGSTETENKISNAEMGVICVSMILVCLCVIIMGMQWFTCLTRSSKGAV